MNKNNTMIPPLFMWAGGKTRMLKKYQPIWPAGDYTSYIEPFLGGASVFSWVCSNGMNHFEKMTINDLNREMMSVFHEVKNNPDEFIEKSTNTALSFLSISVDDKNERKKFYYRLRESYWKNPTTDTLYILMRLGFNGIWQTCKDSHGLFGTPAGLLNQTRLNQIVDKESIMFWHNQLQDTTMYSTDYADIDFEPMNSLIYLDPPYRGSFTTYGVDFDDDEQRRLCEWSLEQADRGATVLLANRDNGDGFFEELLGERAEFHYFDVKYTAGRRKKEKQGYSAKSAREFLAIIH